MESWMIWALCGYSAIAFVVSGLTSYFLMDDAGGAPAIVYGTFAGLLWPLFLFGLPYLAVLTVVSVWKKIQKILAERKMEPLNSMSGRIVENRMHPLTWALTFWAIVGAVVFCVATIFSKLSR